MGVRFSSQKSWGQVLLVAALAIAAGFSVVAQNKSKTSASPVYGYKVINTYPHDRGAFTEGFFYQDGFLWEGTGLEGRSSVRRVKLETGQVLQQYRVPPEYFGEGLIAVGNELFELTYKHGIAFVYDKTTFALKKQFTYKGEGWGMTTDGRRILMSDGTSQLRWLDPKTFRELGRISVTEGGKPVSELNELELIKGEIWANIWEEDRIARIDPATGRVKSWVDLSGILSVMEARNVDVLNGIAYDAKGDRIFVTGKYWPRVFEIQVGSRR